MKIIIKDFQALEEVKLDVQGLTLLVGESGAGKSSVCRALQAALFNRFKGGQVRFGQDHATIKVKFEDKENSLTVVRSWAGGSPQIKLGDLTFSKLGRNLPKEVQDYVNFGTLEIGGELYSCNIHPQFQRPLLHEFSQQKVMELLSASSALDDLKEAKEVVLEDRTKVKGSIQAVDQMLSSVTQQVNEGKQFISTVEPLVAQIGQVSEGLIKIQSLLDSTVSLKKAIIENSKTLSYEAILQDKIIACKDALEVTNGLVKIQNLRSYLSQQDLVAAIILILDKILKIVPRLLLMDSVSKIRNLNQTLFFIEQQEKITLTKVSLLTQKLDIMKSYDSYRTTLGTVSSLRTVLTTFYLIEEKEKTLKNIVENHICPVCGNKVQ